MLPIVQLGPLSIQTPGLIILVGIWLGLTAAERFAVRQGITSSTIDQIVFTSLLTAILASRAAFIALNFAAFSSRWTDIFSLNPQLLDPWGGMVGFFLSLLISAQRKHITLAQLADALALGAAIFLISISLANLASGSAFGEPAELPWAINLWGARRHPSQIYEGLAILLGYFVLSISSWRKSPQPTGLAAAHFLTWVSLVYLFLGAYRAHGSLLPGNLRAIQVSAWFGLFGSLLWIYRIKYRLKLRGDEYVKS